MSRKLRSTAIGLLALVVASTGLVVAAPVVDAAPPPAPAIRLPLANSTLTVAAPAIAGSAEVGAEVEAFATPTGGGAATSLGTATAGSDGRWIVDTSTTLVDGTYDITATAVNGDGASEASVAVPVTIDGPGAGQTNITLVSINDFHGRIDANTLKWAGTVATVAATAGGDDVAITGAGDLVGASLFASAVAEDQPTIDVMNAIGLDASAVGNHEFDQGWLDLRDRIIGPDGNRNAKWEYLGANVFDTTTGEPLLPEFEIITINGIRVGVIGAVTEETPALVSPGGMVGVTIGDPVAAVNDVAERLSDADEGNGEADVLIATFHEGAPSGTQTLEENIAASTVFADIVNNVSGDVDVLFNGHTHQAYVYTAAKPGGGERPVLQTGNYGEWVGKVVLTVDTSSKEVVGAAAQNVARSTLADNVLLQQFPELVTVQDIVNAALTDAAEVGNTPKGLVSNDITTAYTGGAFGPTGYRTAVQTAGRDQRNLESTLGGLVANVLKDTLEPLGVDLPTDAGTVGVVNPGGLRDELYYPTSSLNEGNGVVTYGEANAVLPFVNNLWTTHLTGAQFKTMLEQQWQRDVNNNVPTRAYLHLGLSDNVSYTFDPALAEGSRITSITIDGQPVDPAKTYKIATFSFLATGGDNFRIFTEGTSAMDSGLVDRDAWIAYLEARMTAPGIAPDYQRRSTSLSPMPTAVTRGERLQTTLSYLDMTSLGTPQNTSVDVSIGGVLLGTVATTFTPAADTNVAPSVGTSGAAIVDVPVPWGVPAGPNTLTFTVRPSGKVVSVPIEVGAGAGEPTLTPTAPARILDTRTGGVTVDHLFEGTGIRGAGTTLELDVLGRGGIPANATGAVLNITATDATGGGYVTAYPCGHPRPEASSLNYVAGAAVPNTVIAAVGANGKVCLYTALSSVHLIADVNGFVDADSLYLPLNPARLADSRPGAVTTDGQYLGTGRRASGSVWEIDVAGRGGVPNDAETAALNVTVAEPTGTGYLTVWPCDAPQPIASSVNYAKDTVVPNAVTTKLSASGTVCVYVGEASTHVIVDVNGAFPPGADYTSVVPARLLDTRNAATVDGQFRNLGNRQPGDVLQLTIAGRGGVPADASGAMLNITTSDATGPGYVTVWPCGGTPPNVSSLNYDTSMPRANASFVSLSGPGTVCLVAMEAATGLIVDVTGYL